MLWEALLTGLSRQGLRSASPGLFMTSFLGLRKPVVRSLGLCSSNPALPVSEVPGFSISAMCMCVYMCICPYRYTFIRMCVCMHTCTCVYVCVCTFGPLCVSYVCVLFKIFWLHEGCEMFCSCGMFSSRLVFMFMFISTARMELIYFSFFIFCR